MSSRSSRSQMGWRNSRNQQLLTSLRKSIVDKPPYISGMLPLPVFCFSLFYKIANDGLAPWFARSKNISVRLTFCHRYINLANATPDELEQLTQACEPASFGPKTGACVGRDLPQGWKNGLGMLCFNVGPFSHQPHK